MNTRKVPRTSNRHLAHIDLQHAHFCGHEPKTLNEVINESQDKLSCLSHKQEKGMAHVTSEVQVAVMAKVVVRHRVMWTGHTSHVIFPCSHDSSMCRLGENSLIPMSSMFAHERSSSPTCTHSPPLTLTSPSLPPSRPTSQSTFPIRKPCSPTPRNEDNGPLAKTQPLTTGRGDKELENFDTSEIHARRLNAKDVLRPQDGEECGSRFADGSVKLAGRDQVFRTSTFIQDHLHEERSTMVFFKQNRTGLQLWTKIRGHFQEPHFVVISIR